MSCKNYKHGFHNYTSLACYVPVALWSATVQIVFASFMMEKKNLPGDAYHIWQHCQFVGKDLRQTTFPRLCSSNIERSDVQGDFCLVTQTTYLRYTVYTSGNWLISHLRKRIIIFISSLVIRDMWVPWRVLQSWISLDHMTMLAIRRLRLSCQHRLTWDSHTVDMQEIPMERIHIPSIIR